MSSILCRRLLPSRFAPIFSSIADLSSTQKPRFLRTSRFLLNPDRSNPSDENSSSSPLVPQPPAVLDKFLVPATVMLTGAMVAPGIAAMASKPVSMWFYRQYYDLNFDPNEFLVGARRALYFVAEKAFQKDFFALRKVLTPEVRKFCTLWIAH